jgi:tRNA-splicing ligase RtcB
MMNDWMQRSNIVFRGGGLDESPHCYKRLPEVLAAHGSTTRILHTPLRAKQSSYKVKADF